jgi:ectoine hydroxylase-related dioxygenase (phytanoyl-CoA dioxygenase family)
MSAVRTAEEVVNDFYRDGYALLGRVLSAEHAQELMALVEARYDDACCMDSDADDVLRGGISLMRIFEYDKRFCSLLELQFAVDIAEQILGKDCHIIAQNALRTPPGRGIINWHIDDALFFPFLAELPGCVQEVKLPCYSLTVMIALCDITDVAFGPTQVVCGSHRTGRVPEYCPILNYHVPRHVLDSASPRLLRLLGRHEKGPYG